MLTPETIAKLKRLAPWIAGAIALVILLVFVHPAGLPAVIGKITMYVVGALLGFYAHHTLMPYQRPSGYLVEPWELSMLFKPGEVDCKVVPGSEKLFAVACAVRAFCMFGGAFVLGLGI